MVGEDKFRQFLKTGWISVRAESGLVYRIGRGHEMAVVYDNGKPVEKLCVVLNDDFPPTDFLIMRFLLLNNNEKLFREKAISWTYREPEAPRAVEQRPLTEVFAEMKGLRLVA